MLWHSFRYICSNFRLFCEECGKWNYWTTYCKKAVRGVLLECWLLLSTVQFSKSGLTPKHFFCLWHLTSSTNFLFFFIFNKCISNFHLAVLSEELRMRNECIQLGRAREGRGKEMMAEVDTVSQVSCKLSSFSYSFQRQWSDSCFKAVLHMHANRAWFQTCELEAHCEVKVTFEKKYVYHLNRNSWSVKSEQEETFGYLIIFPVQTMGENSKT